MDEIELDDEVLDAVEQTEDEVNEKPSDFELASDTAIKPIAEGTEGIE